MFDPKQAAEEYLSGKKVTVFCGTHGYFPETIGVEATGLIPPMETRCPDCWKAYYLTYFAKLPANMRAQRLDELEAALNHAAEFEDKNEFDFKLDRHPKIAFSHEE